MTQTPTNSKNRTPTRARGERVYKPGGKKEWRVVFWTHESTKPSRRQCSFSEAKYGKEAASLLSRAVLDYIDVKGVIPDDLHDPPILDPAKKELIEYYSALHESRKASQKRTRQRGGAATAGGGVLTGEGIVKESSDPTVVPLYTLANSQSSPLSTNSFSPIQSALSTKSESPDGPTQKYINKKERKHFDPGVIPGPHISVSHTPFIPYIGTAKTHKAPDDITSSSSVPGTGGITTIGNGASVCGEGIQNFVQIPPIPRISAQSQPSSALIDNISISRESNLRDIFPFGNGGIHCGNTSTFAPATGNSNGLESVLDNNQNQSNHLTVPHFGLGATLLGIGAANPNITHPGIFVPSTFQDTISPSSFAAAATLGVTSPEIWNLIGQNLNQIAAIHCQQLQFCLMQHLAGSYPTIPILQNSSPIIGFDNQGIDSLSQKASLINNNINENNNKHTHSIFCNGSGIADTSNSGIPKSQQLICDVNIAQDAL